MAIKRNVFKFGAGMQHRYGPDHQRGDEYFDPEFPSGLKFKSKPLQRQLHGDFEYREHRDATVNHRGRAADFSHRAPIDEVFGVHIVTKPSRRR